MKWALAAVALAVGVFAVVAGGADDSPGLQLIGVLFVVAAATVLVRRRRAGS